MFWCTDPSSAVLQVFYLLSGIAFHGFNKSKICVVVCQPKLRLTLKRMQPSRTELQVFYLMSGVATEGFERVSKICVVCWLILTRIRSAHGPHSAALGWSHMVAAAVQLLDKVSLDLISRGCPNTFLLHLDLTPTLPTPLPYPPPPPPAGGESVSRNFSYCLMPWQHSEGNKPPDMRCCTTTKGKPHSPCVCGMLGYCSCSI